MTAVGQEMGEAVAAFLAARVEAGGRRQVISQGSDVVGSYDPATGRELWRVRYAGFSQVPRPVFGHGLVFVCTGYNAPSLLAIRPDGDGDVTDTHVAWAARRNVAHSPSLLLHGDELYMVSDAGIVSFAETRRAMETMPLRR